MTVYELLRKLKGWDPQGPNVFLKSPVYNFNCTCGYLLDNWGDEMKDLEVVETSNDPCYILIIAQ